jgi:hypothetical protein
MVRHDGERELVLGDLRHGSEVFRWVVVQLARHQGIHHGHGDRREQERCTVRGGAPERIDGDASGRAGLVLHDDRSRELASQAFRDRSGDDVARPARRDGNEDADDLAPALIRGGDRRRRSGERCAEQQA